MTSDPSVAAVTSRMPQIVTGAFPSRGVVTEPWRPPVQRRRTRVTLKSPRCHKVLFLFIVTRGGGGEGPSLLAVGCVCSKLPTVYSRRAMQGGGGRAAQKEKAAGGGGVVK